MSDGPPLDHAHGRRRWSNAAEPETSFLKQGAILLFRAFDSAGEHQHDHVCGLREGSLVRSWDGELDEQNPPVSRNGFAAVL